MSWCRTSIDVGEAHWHFLFKHLRGPTCWAAAPGWQDSHSSCFSWLWGIFRWTNSQCSPHMPRTSSEIPASAKPRGKQTKIELSRSSCLLSPRNTLHVMLENYFLKVTATYVVTLYAISSTKRTRWWTLPTTSFSLNKSFWAKHTVLGLDETHRSESVKTLNRAKKQTDEVLLRPFFYRSVSRWRESLQRVQFHWCHKTDGWICRVQVSLVWGKQFRQLPGMNNMDFIQVQERFFLISVQVKEKVYNTVNENKRQQRDVSGIVMVRHTKRATVPTPLTVCLWAHVPLIAASTEPADCTHHPLLASKKPHTELYEIFIQCVHFSSLFPIPHLGPPLPFKLRHQTDKKDFSLPCFSARLPSCPEALEYLVSSLTANITPLSARSKNLIGGNVTRRKDKNGGWHQEVWWMRFSVELGVKP